MTVIEHSVATDPAVRYRGHLALGITVADGDAPAPPCHQG
jgi:hypothetical protein